jgi:hypothetical protein
MTSKTPPKNMGAIPVRIVVSDTEMAANNIKHAEWNQEHHQAHAGGGNTEIDHRERDNAWIVERLQ